MPIVQFAPFQSLVQPDFWHALTNLKIDVLRLSDHALPVSASYTAGRAVKDRETGTEIALGCNLTLGGDAFSESPQAPANAVLAKGSFKNFNTIEDFKNADKTALFNQTSDETWKSIVEDKCTALLTHFLLITFADLKKYKYFYWFAFPAFAAKPAWEIDGDWSAAPDVLGEDALSAIHAQLHQSLRPFFLVRTKDGKTEIALVEEYDKFFADVPADQRTIGFLDPSAQPNNPGWPLRNLLAYLTVHHPETARSVRILCWRDVEPGILSGWKSRFGILRQGSSDDAAAPADMRAKPAAVGWEKNIYGKLGPRVADLAPMMDPARLADQAVDLNLKLMRWRILPALDLDTVASTRCLLLGAGTLGCYVARTLMSLTDRTLDQMCTVTRPGLAPIAASTAVELLVSMLQHPEGIHAPAPPPQSNNSDTAAGSESILGIVPHQIRGFLAQFRNVPIVGPAYTKCTGCSETVVKGYEKDGFEMLLRAFNEPEFLPRLTGLDKLYEEAQAALENGDMVDAEEDDF
ncbi:hypothetical protein BN946_scf184707.g4 [Trametes cinnabarina]|uniref:Ubiquitin-like modifier-activating enzyme Atg7 N-terminal domain-containing protein n=1 Tax=Pycnoporus cinnabarinus TaxID=5643 RepID=A0A060S7Q8_PYCCI|nr:hypothetical protein BN946_scf184707.g4 [Trametes cinnabarina]